MSNGNMMDSGFANPDVFLYPSLMEMQEWSKRDFPDSAEAGFSM